MASNPARRVQYLISTIDDDRELLRAIEEVEQETESWVFGRTASSWARTLYDRNSNVFLPLIMRHLRVWGLQGSSGLEEWLQQAAEQRHHALFRILYRTWLHDTVGWGKRQEQWSEDLRLAFREAEDRVERGEVLERYDLSFEIPDEDAVELYETDAAVMTPWIRARIDRLPWTMVAYEKLGDAARAAGDDDLFYYLYSHTFPLDRWLEDVRRLAEEIADPDELNRELERRHFRGPESSVDPVGLVDLLEKRGADVRPYLVRFIPRCSTWGSNPAWKRMTRLAAERGWWDIWAMTVRNHFHVNDFNELIVELVEDTERPEWHIAALLAKVAGTEYGWGDWRRPVALTTDAALALYRRFPELARGLFIDHVRPDHRNAYVDLAAEAESQGDTTMIDLLAARAVTIAWSWSRQTVENVGWYVEHYEALDPEAFATRAVDVVSHVKPFEFMARNGIRKRNPLYPVFFRDVARYRPVAHRVRGLLESPCEETRRLGLEIFGLKGVEGATLAAENVDHLLAYLLNEATRRTRIAAFEALVLASSTDEDLGRTIVDRARETLDLRRKAYPRDRLIELIGRVIHRWPALRTEREQPVVYEQEAS